MKINENWKIFQSLRGYSDVFTEEISGLPLKRELYFTIELVPGAVPTSKAPYQMNILELNELKSQLKELIDKKYIRPSMSLLGEHLLFLLKRRTVLYAYALITASLIK